MEYYTEEQVSRMLVSAIDRTASLMQDDESLPSEEAINNIIYIAKVHPSTFEMQKQIEAVRGLIESHKDLFKNTKEQLVTFASDTALERHVEAMNSFSDSIRTLTETLKPYLGDDKLEV
jgi:predicted oxidoreductase (fatty acid repression mutant protein)